MKILMIVPYVFYRPTGSPLSVYYRLKAIGDLGYQIDVVTYHLGKDVNLNNVNIFRILSVPFIRKIKVGEGCLKIPLDILLFLEVFRLLLYKKYDIIYTHAEAGFMGLLFKKLFGISFVYDCHSSFPYELDKWDFLNNKFMFKVFRFIEYANVKNAGVTITHCQNIAELFVNSKISNNIFVLENTNIDNILASVEQADVVNLRKELDIHNKVVILYTGSFLKVQGLALFIDSIKKVVEKNKNIKCILIGATTKDLPDVKQQIANKGLDKYFCLIERTPLEETKLYLEMADIVVSPRSIGIDLPLKILIYMQSGKPIVATNRSLHTQILDNNCAVLVEPDPDDFAKGILNLVENEKLRIEIGNKSKEQFHKKYSYDVFLDKMSKYLLKCLNKK